MKTKNSNCNVLCIEVAGFFLEHRYARYMSLVIAFGFYLGPPYSASYVLMFPLNGVQPLHATAAATAATTAAATTAAATGVGQDHSVVWELNIPVFTDILS